MVSTMVEEELYCHLRFPIFPRGPKTFEMADKFSYVRKIKLSSSNVAPFRCALEVSKMTKDYSEDNLISKTEKFISQSILHNLRDSIEMMSLAESLGIVEKCIDYIATKVSIMDLSLFSWSMYEQCRVLVAEGWEILLDPPSGEIGGLMNIYSLVLLFSIV
ncbi:hypothetical protein L2E82_00150 [Cichorium intybus]|uniref:Uncharacterized protein n=1 Tax=Cichorium intybus TaxID=13427 RepID=A0ACB9GWK8_CICIN|nr:hypothetical protein L2E82_00150 [Cichorium intybus]